MSLHKESSQCRPDIFPPMHVRIDQRHLLHSFRLFVPEKILFLQYNRMHSALARQVPVKSGSRHLQNAYSILLFLPLRSMLPHPLPVQDRLNTNCNVYGYLIWFLHFLPDRALTYSHIALSLLLIQHHPRHNMQHQHNLLVPYTSPNPYNFLP